MAANVEEEQVACRERVTAGEGSEHERRAPEAQRVRRVVDEVEMGFWPVQMCNPFSAVEFYWALQYLFFLRQGPFF